MGIVEIVGSIILFFVVRTPEDEEAVRFFRSIFK